MTSASPDRPATRVLLLMGVCGCGKTTVGRLLAEDLGWAFIDGDDLHPPENVKKMASGTPLDDRDRQPWLQTIRQTIDRHLAENRGLIIACSALKESYRKLLMEGTRGVRLIHLHGDPALLARRMSERQGHYMKAGMLESQLRALEPPRDALTVGIDRPPREMADEILKNLKPVPSR